MIKLSLTNHLYCPVFIYLLFIIFLSIPVRLNGKIEDNRNLFFKLNSKLGLYHVVLTTRETSPKKTIVEMPQLPDIEETDSKEEVTCLNQ